MGRGVFVTAAVSYPLPVCALRARTDLPHKGGGVWSEWESMSGQAEMKR